MGTFTLNPQQKFGVSASTSPSLDEFWRTSSCTAIFSRSQRGIAFASYRSLIYSWELFIVIFYGLHSCFPLAVMGSSPGMEACLSFEDEETKEIEAPNFQALRGNYRTFIRSNGAVPVSRPFIMRWHLSCTLIYDSPWHAHFPLWEQRHPCEHGRRTCSKCEAAAT